MQNYHKNKNMGKNRIKLHPITVVGVHLDFYYSE